MCPAEPRPTSSDAVWLAKLTEKGLLRPSFVPPAPIRELRDYTRLRTDLTRERSRRCSGWRSCSKTPLIKLSAVATDIMGVSGRAMLEALIAGERDPTAARRAGPRPDEDQTARPWSPRSTVGSTTITPNSPGCCWTRSTP